MISYKKGASVLAKKYAGGGVAMAFWHIYIEEDIQDEGRNFIPVFNFS